ncbi:glutamate racemase [Coriobacteriia bacterium Es71-Z0120]|uniref:glutamate racemase n=1 Tax=Parvivirga hydrogeniphila TaxID=2939460 RepID=UPI0022609C45|nr:glutamate racemase [Parvivirga hydrogeniphila]MCL4078754.1 glutamate racemase [Parvivirga hydrogeniphila]
MRDVRDRPIGVFDSGLGGLTVVRELVSALPHESVLYLGDTARCPYGPREPDEVRRFVLQIGAWLSAQEIKLMVIACNTATASGLALAQQTFDVPVIGVVEPGARAAVQATRNRRVGVIGTVGTVRSGAYSDAVRALDAGVTVFSAPAPKFVDIVEAGLRMDDSALESLMSQTTDVFVRPSFYELARDYLDPLKRAGIDTLVLGCTHFPLLSTAIQQVVGPSVRLISSAEETAREVRETLEVRGHAAPAAARPAHRFVTTGDPEEFERLGSRILGWPTGPVEAVGVEELERLLTPDPESMASARPEEL